MNDSSNTDTTSPLSPVENDHNQTFLQQVKSIHSLAIHFDKEILVNSNNGLRVINFFFFSIVYWKTAIKLLLSTFFK